MEELEEERRVLCMLCKGEQNLTCPADTSATFNKRLKIYKSGLQRDKKTPTLRFLFLTFIHLLELFS